MASRILHYERVGDPVRVIKLQLRPPASAPVVLTQGQKDAINASLRASATAGTIPGGNFWVDASLTEKALIVAGGLGAAVILYFALKPRRGR